MFARHPTTSTLTIIDHYIPEYFHHFPNKLFPSQVIYGKDNQSKTEIALVSFLTVRPFLLALLSYFYKNTRKQGICLILLGFLGIVGNYAMCSQCENDVFAVTRFLLYILRDAFRGKGNYSVLYINGFFTSESTSKCHHHENFETLSTI